MGGAWEATLPNFYFKGFSKRVSSLAMQKEGLDLYLIVNAQSTRAVISLGLKLSHLACSFSCIMYLLFSLYI